ncbi:MAG: PspC domain-containing protein [Brooklawnia sp.]|uniref:PspC domain-containing protein n=1 Tax=Brooklawnia sp. TaxID=2699740 RepID=UPI003C7858D9
MTSNWRQTGRGPRPAVNPADPAPVPARYSPPPQWPSYGWAPPASQQQHQPPRPDQAPQQQATQRQQPGVSHPASPANQSPAGRSHPTRPPLYRDRNGAWLGGVASGIARHLGWPAWLIRLCFIGLTLSNILTVAVYGVLWMVLPDTPPDDRPPGLKAASHQGLREEAVGQRRGSNVGRVTAVLMIGFGLVMLAQALGLGIANAVFWPAIVAAIGVALVWLQADAPDDGETGPSGVPQWVAPLLGTRKWSATLRIVLGMGLVGAAVSMMAASQIGVGQLPTVLWVAGLTLAGVGMVAAPWVLRYRRKLDSAREEKLIADTRADMAAHLHDSVLQTLALIQRQSDDPRQVAALARRQERELRNWLYADPSGPETLQAALAAAGGEVEDEHGVPVEVVCVGDIDLDNDLKALVQAAREAMVNAAKHSGAGLIDVYAEVDRDEGDPVVQVFVRDRGKGFDLSGIADDRMGVRGSIIRRMERHGGTARVRSAPGEGTEIRLEMKA